MTLRIWDAATGRLVDRLLGHPAEVETVTFTSNGNCLVSGDQNGILKYWDITALTDGSMDLSFLK